MLQKCRILLLLCTLAVPSLAQTSEVIRALRPGQTVIPFTVGKNIFQFHAAGDFGGYEDGALKDKFQNNNAIFCYGISETFEVNVAFETRRDKLSGEGGNTTSSGLSLAVVGARVNILDGGDNGLSLGGECFLKAPVLSRGYATNFIAPKILMTGMYNFMDAKISLTGNLGVEYDGMIAAPVGLYVVGVFCAVGKNYGVFAENFGTFKSDYIYSHIDAGAYYLPNKDLQFDFSIGKGQLKARWDYFASFGMSYRLHNPFRNRHL